MIMTSALKRICDISFYMTFATAVAWILGGDATHGIALTLPIFILTAFLAAYLTKWGQVRYLAVLPLMTVFLVVPVYLVNVIVLLSAVMLMVYTLPRPNEQPSTFDYQRIFRIFMRIFLLFVVFFIFSVIIDMTTGPQPRTLRIMYFSLDILIFAISFLLNSVVFMRMIRHDVAVLKQTRFKVMNAIPLAVLTIGAIVASNQAFLRFFFGLLGSIFGILWFRGIAHVYYWFVLMLTWPLRNWEIEPLVSEEDYTYLNGIGYYEGEHDRNIDQSFAAIEPGNLLIIIVGVFLIIGLIILFKMLIKPAREQDLSDVGLEEEWSFLDDEQKKRRRFQRRNENQIRTIYAKFLKLLKRKEFIFPLSATSLELEQLVATKFNSKELADLRAAYIKVRYRESEYSQDDVAQVKEFYKKIKDELENDRSIGR